MEVDFGIPGLIETYLLQEKLFSNPKKEKLNKNYLSMTELYLKFLIWLFI
jgi:hypothetical protein